MEMQMGQQLLQTHNQQVRQPENQNPASVFSQHSANNEAVREVPSVTDVDYLGRSSLNAEGKINHDQTRRRPPFRSNQAKNNVDSWIDELDENHVEDPSEMLSEGMNHQAMMGWMIQQYLPNMKLPHFDGSPIDWVPFIVKFRDVVHRQKYLFNEQRSYLLMQHLKCEPERAIRSYVNDPSGYVFY